MRIVAQATAILRKKAASGKVTKEMVQTWLVNNIKWGLHHVPDATTVDNHMRNWEKIQKNPRTQNHGIRKSTTAGLAYSEKSRNFIAGGTIGNKKRYFGQIL